MNIKTLFPNASKDTVALNARLQNPEPQRDQAPALDAAVQRKTDRLSRPTVRFIGFRCHPLDPDNFAGGCKDLLDALVHSGLLYGDEPWRINFETRQEKVLHRRLEKTVIEIEY